MDNEEAKLEEEVKKVIVSVTTDAVKPKGTPRRNSTGNLSGRASPSHSNSDEKNLPHYLRASSSSCHEFCKYGKKHTFDPKERKPVFPRSTDLSNAKQKREVSDVKVRRKKPASKVEATRETEDGGLLEPTANELLEASESKRFESPSPSQERIDSFGQSPFSELPPALQIEELSDSSETARTQSSSPTEKRVISHEPAAPSTWSDRMSEDYDVIRELEIPSPVCNPEDQVEASSEKGETEVIAHPDETVISKAIVPPEKKSLKAKVSPPSKRTIGAKGQAARGETSLEKASGLKLKTPSPKDRTVAATKEQILTGKFKTIDRKKSEEADVRTKATKEKEIEVSKKPTGTKMNLTSRKSDIAERKSPSFVKKVNNPVTQRSPPSTKKVMASVSPSSTKKDASLTVKTTGTLVRSPSSVKPRTPAVSKSTPSLISLKRVPSLKLTGNKLLKSVDLSKRRDSPALRSPRLSRPSAEITKSRNLKASAPARIQRKVGKSPENSEEKVKEKTLYVIEPKTRYLDPKSETNNEGNAKSTQYRSSALALGKKQIEKKKPVQSPPTSEEKNRVRRTKKTINPEVKPPSPHKLKFNRGKVVDPVPESNSPRKLRFRVAKGLSEGVREAGRRIIHRRRRSSFGSAGELIIPRLQAPKVALRHQDVKEKKDPQGLFNHVIEETATKLVEVKKSRVKALVGAFETVISLQEGRASPVR